MASYQLIGVPFDLHRPDERMGASPALLLPHLAKLNLPWVAAPQLVEVAELTGAQEDDLARIAAVVADAVRAARSTGAVPLLIGGDCLTAIGAVGGLDGTVSVAWLDAHGDFNTPETTPSGYLGGMPLAALTGRCLTTITAAAGIAQPVDEAQIALIGVRDLDPPEAAVLADSAVAVLSAAELRADPARLDAALTRITPDTTLYLHLDVDVLASELVPGVVYPTPDGWQLDELAQVVRAIRACTEPAVIAITAINASGGDQERILASALELVSIVCSPFVNGTMG
jgi:arginase